MRTELVKFFLAAAIILLTGCGRSEGVGALTVTIPGAGNDPHKQRVQELLQIIADRIDTVVTVLADGSKSSEVVDESYDRWHAARKELPEILRADDVPAMKTLILDHSGLKLRKEHLSEEEEFDRTIFSSMCMRILRDHHIRTNDPQVTAFYLELLRGMNRGYLLDALLVWEDVGDEEHMTGKRVFLPGLEKTDWPEALHREYLKLDTADALTAACELLYAGEKYKDEATWFLCRILKEPEWAYSAERMELESARRRANYAPAVTPREAAVVDALGIMFVRSMGAQDRELYAKYVIPWAKHSAAEGPPAVRAHARPLVDPADPFEAWHIDLDKIPAGTPVPPKPDTVIEPKDEKSKAE